MNEREKLIKEIDKALGYAQDTVNYLDLIADFILKDRRRICAPILESLSTNDLEISYPIKETLRLAGLEPK